MHFSKSDSPNKLCVLLLIAVQEVFLADARNTTIRVRSDLTYNFDYFHSIARLFDKVFVLCIDKRCKRHQPNGGFWPADIQSNVVVFDGRQLHKHFPELQILFPSPSTYLYHKFITLLFFTHMVTIAKHDGLQNVLYVEDDVQAMPAGPVHSITLQNAMAREDWDLLRLGALWNSGVSGPESPAGCRQNCECRDWGPPKSGLCTTDTFHHTNFSNYRLEALSTNFDASHPPTMFEESQLADVGCVLKSAISVGVNKPAFDDIEAMLNYILLRMKLSTGLRCAGDSPEECARHQCRYINATNSKSIECTDDNWFRNSLPWIDVWLPSSFRNVYIVPAVVTQHTTGRDSGTKFLELCGGASRKPKEELTAYRCKVSIDRPGRCVH
jgi:hypothetical protein